MKAQNCNYQTSVFNTYLPLAANKAMVFNSLTAQTVEVSDRDAFQLQSGTLDRMSQSKLKRFAEKGMVCRRGEDEVSDFFRRVNRRKQGERWADITLLSSPNQESQKQEKKVMSALGDYAGKLKTAEGIDLIKGRFCGFGSRSVRERLLLFEVMLQSLHKAGLPIITMWMSDLLLEILKTPMEIANSFFYQVDLSKPLLPDLVLSKVFFRIRQLVSKGKAVMIQFALNRLSDIERQSRSLQNMANLAADIDPDYLKWGMQLKQKDIDLYYSPEDCAHPDPEQGKVRIRCKQAFNALGIVIPIQLKLPQFHHDCPGAQIYSQTFDWRGAQYACLKNVSYPAVPIERPLDLLCTATGPDNRAQEKCLNCSIMPLCLAICPLHVDREKCFELTTYFQLQLHSMISGHRNEISV